MKAVFLQGRRKDALYENLFGLFLGRRASKKDIILTWVN